MAGNFQSGCTNANAGNFNPEARVDDGSCQTVGVLAGSTRTELMVVRGGHRIPVVFPHSGGYTVKLRDIRGAIAWEKTFPQGHREIAVGQDVKAGVYQLEARNGRNLVRRCLVLP